MFIKGEMGTNMYVLADGELEVRKGIDSQKKIIIFFEN